MYGGLFGDLPAARGEAGDNDNKDGRKEQQQHHIGHHSSHHHHHHHKQKKSGASSSAHQQPTSHTNHPITQAVGASGTSFAFVPTTIKRKRPNRFAKLTDAPKVPPPTTTSTTTPTEAAAAAVAPSPFLQSVTTSTTTVTTTASSVAAHEPAINIHEQQWVNHRDHHSNENDKTADLKGYHHIPQSSSQNKTHHDEAAEITDPYDPRVPNDLLQYWDRQRLAQEREALEKETREALENQKRLRQRLEKEREELQLTGDYTKILEASSNEVVAVASSGGMGRGRGRGVSNLPAWLVEKQQKEAEELGRT